MEPRASLLLRSLLAVALFVGFYAFALGMAAFLLALPILEIALAERIHAQLVILGLGGGLIILWSILPRFDRFVAPGPRLEARDHPRLFDEIGRIARATGQAPPAEVYLVPDINAWVAQRGGLMGIGSRRVMGLGLPLLQVLTVSELRAVLAHEFGHYHGGDTALGPWIWRTREAILRTIANLGSTGMALIAIVQVPFTWYGKLFLRITLAVSRAQEFAADRLAARLEGPTALVTGLKKIHGAAHAFEPYFQEEFAPVLSRGYRPPLAAGFAAFLAAPAIALKLGELIDREIRAGTGDPYDSHPPLGARIAALEAFEASSGEADPRPGIALLDGVSDAEQALFAKVLPKAADLPPVTWDDVPERVLAPGWQEIWDKVGPWLSGRTIGGAPADRMALGEVGKAWLGEQAQVGELGERERADVGVACVEAAIGLALLARGWRAAAPPGDMTRFEHDGHVLVPRRTFRDILDDKAPYEAWASEAAAAGVADVPLGPQSAS